MKYRISYGNGQASNIFRTHDEARQALLWMSGDAWVDHFRIERQTEDGEWVDVRSLAELRRVSRPE